MCALSMVADAKNVEWENRYFPQPTITSTIAFPTQVEIDEFRRLLERARQYDIEHNQPDCELDEKKKKLLKLAGKLGVEIDFL